ncbi:MAG TPA: hypothetical protein VFT45_28210 [Longimicrobium sp.]|nr:hypothetical protein [Longimicrobium sp.]
MTADAGRSTWGARFLIGWDSRPRDLAGAIENRGYDITLSAFRGHDDTHSAGFLHGAAIRNEPQSIEVDPADDVHPT